MSDGNKYEERNKQGNKIKIIMMERILIIGWLQDLFEEMAFKLRLIDEMDLVRKRARRESVPGEGKDEFISPEIRQNVAFLRNQRKNMSVVRCQQRPDHSEWHL